MLSARAILTSTNLNSAYISKTDIADQTVSSNFKVGGGKVTLKNSILSDNTNSTYLQINPQGSQLIIYDGVTDQTFRVYSRSGGQSIRLQSVGGTTPYGKIEMDGLSRLEINTTNNMPVTFGSGDITTKGHLYINAPSSHLLFQDGSGTTKFYMEYASGNTSLRVVDSGGVYPLTAFTGGKLMTKSNTLDDGVTGASIFAGGMTLNNTLVVSGATTISGTATFANSSTFNSSVIMNGALSLPTSGAGIEIGSLTAANNPYLDFHSSGFNNDYDARILASGGASGNSLGTIQLISQAVTTSGVLKPYRLVLPVGTNLYA